MHALRSLLLGTLALGLAAQAPARRLKVYISVDMEGITGVVHKDQISPGPEYAAARKWMASDVNAAVQGALDAGATEVVVCDGHGPMTNLQVQDLHPKASLVTGTPRPFGMMQGLDATFDAVFCVGYHAAAGVPDGVLAHTISGATVLGVKVNGRELPELGLNAWLAGACGIPVVLVTGDQSICGTARQLLGASVATAPVKVGIGANAAHTLGLEASRRLIQDAARQALEGRAQVKPFRPAGPYRVEVSFVRAAMADQAMGLPGLTRVDGRTVAFERPEVEGAYRLLRTVIGLGGL